MTADGAPGETVVFEFDGAVVTAEAGQSLAAALAAAGHRVLGSRRDGGGQAPFCGMGLCHECLVTVDGRTAQRACLVPVAPGLRVASHRYAVKPAPRPPGDEAARTVSADVVVVGGGPAGLSAARAAARCGATVVVVDERERFGGQYYKQPATGAARAGAGDRRYRDGAQLIDAVQRAGVTLLGGVSVWGAFSPQDLAAVGPHGAVTLRGRQLILATGAYERVAPFPGWTLPGVMTTGAMQSLQRRYGVTAGRRVVLAGNGPLNVQVASELLAAGVEVVAVVDAAPLLARPAAALAAFRSGPGLVLEGLRELARLRRAGVALRFGCCVTRADGAGSVQTVTVAPCSPDGRADARRQETFEADILCVGHGFWSSNELARGLGCDVAYDRRRHGLVVTHDEEGRTSVDGVLVAGDGAALNGAQAALAAGFAAGCAAARACGLAVPQAVEAERQQNLRALSRHLAFQDAIWRLFAAPWPGASAATPDTHLCRCEQVTRGDVEAAVAAGAKSLGELKRRTRLGMGRCQGRYCVGVALDLLGPQAWTQALAGQAPRAPVRPVPIASIVRPPPP